MPIDFTCPHCGQKTIVADQYAGTSGPCAGCGEQISIPGTEGSPFMSPAPMPPKSSSSGGWSIALIVALAGIVPLIMCGGILIALLLPAIQAAREAARRTQCNNNLKNISLGLLNYHDTYKTFPAGVHHAGRQGESERLGPSWWVGTLPFMEQRNTYDHLMSLQQPGAPGNGAYNAQNVIANAPAARLDQLVPDYMRCPSSPLPGTETQTGPVALPTYVGIAGGCDIDPASSDYISNSSEIRIPVPSSSQPYTSRQKGVGHVPGGIITSSGMLPACQYKNIASCTDGTSNTMIVGEQSDWLRDVNPGIGNRYHGDPGWDTSGTGPPTPSTTDGGGFLSGTVESTRVPMAQSGAPGSPPAAYDCYNITTVRYPADLKRALGNTAFPGCSEDHGINNPLQASHPGGVLVAFVDGSVQFISGTTDLSVLLKIAICNDGQNIRLY